MRFLTQERKSEDLGADIATVRTQLKPRAGDPASRAPAVWGIAKKITTEMKIGFDSRITVG